MAPRTLFDKVWASHVVHQSDDGPALLYVDLHLVHEVTSPQAFEGLRMAGRKVRRPELTVATVDHNVPTGDRRLPIADETSARQVAALVGNAREAGIELFDLEAPEQGIVHVIGPELGLTRPGMVIVCGDNMGDIFRRNSFNLGLHVVQSPEAVADALVRLCAERSKPLHHSAPPSRPPPHGLAAGRSE